MMMELGRRLCHAVSPLLFLESSSLASFRLPRALVGSYKNGICWCFVALDLRGAWCGGSGNEKRSRTNKHTTLDYWGGRPR
uniref:Putative secreted protein n=1 Tax=Anopheles triannulatus TaxID=58253 RepID=A0A2M4B608_9DIPT